MKKFFLCLTIFALCLSFVGCNSLGYSIDGVDFDFSGATGSSQGSALILSAPSKNSDAPIKLLEVVENTLNPSDKYNEKYFSYKLSLNEDKDGKLSSRILEKTYMNPKKTDKPSNAEDFVYIGSLMSNDVYELGEAYEVKFTASNGGGAVFNTMMNFNIDGNNAKLFNFLRYVYIQTSGKLELSFEYDTSFVYQTDDVSGGHVLRVKVNVEKFELANGLTFEDFFSAKIGNSTLVKIFHNLGACIDFTPLEENLTMETGASVWCDVFVGLTLLEGDKGHQDLWNYMLYYYSQF